MIYIYYKSHIFHLLKTLEKTTLNRYLSPQILYKSVSVLFFFNHIRAKFISFLLIKSLCKFYYRIYFLNFQYLTFISSVKIIQVTYIYIIVCIQMNGVNYLTLLLILTCLQPISNWGSDQSQSMVHAVECCLSVSSLKSSPVCLGQISAIAFNLLFCLLLSKRVFNNKYLQ